MADTTSMTTATLDAQAPTDLSELVEPLKRELAVPGEFASVFPSTSDEDLTGSLMDAVGKAQLDGFFSSQVTDLDTGLVMPGMSSGGQALVILYAAESVIRAQLRNMTTTNIYEAAGVKYETQRASNVLTTELKDLQARKDKLLQLILRMQRAGQAVYVTDAYIPRAFGYIAATGAIVNELGFGFYGWEYPAFFGDWK